MVIEIYLTN